MPVPQSLVVIRQEKKKKKKEKKKEKEKNGKLKGRVFSHVGCWISQGVKLCATGDDYGERTNDCRTSTGLAGIQSQIQLKPPDKLRRVIVHVGFWVGSLIIGCFSK